MAVHTPAYKVDGGGPASIQVVTWRSVNMFNTNFNSSDNLIELRSGCNISVVVGDLAGTWSDGSVDFAIAVKDFAKTVSTGSFKALFIDTVGTALVAADGMSQLLINTNEGKAVVGATHIRPNIKVADTGGDWVAELAIVFTPVALINTSRRD